VQHRTTLEHNLRAGEATIQIDYLDSKQANTGNPLDPERCGNAFPLVAAGL
jgi:hypothetical protein